MKELEKAKFDIRNKALKELKRTIDQKLKNISETSKSVTPEPKSDNDPSFRAPMKIFKTFSTCALVWVPGL